VDPAELVVPIGVDTAAVVFLDQMVPRELLGPGVFELEMEHRETFTGNLPRGPCAASAGAGGPAANDAHAIVTASPPVQEAAQAIAKPEEGHCEDEPPPKKARVLEDNSDERDEPLDSVLEKMAGNIRQAFDAGDLVAEDPFNPKTVEFWLRVFVDHVERNSEVFSDRASKDVQLALIFCRYVVKKLVGSECFHVLQRLVPLLSQLAAGSSWLLPSAANAIIGLWEYWSDTAGEPTMADVVARVPQFLLELDLAARTQLNSAAPIQH
jgi:hypothetical protein